jgi:alanyl-tRNA synthetase
MHSNDIRRAFIDFFTSRDHTEVPSASLIPIDPTLLLTNAGMVPFKPYMLGEESPPYQRAVTIQKCARTVDIDIVGTTQRHLTFFEMLGNFSFGDYFKELAIPWAYELLTESFGIDADRLWYTVHLDDDEAAEIWIDGVGVPADRVQRLDRDNFWQMGVPGPAGPSSEIFFDKGAEYGLAGGPAVDDERHVEIWNLVFMQYVQDEPYHVVGNLPAKNIDTGAGLERLSTVLQQVDSIFDTDLIRPVMAAAEAATGLRYGADERSDVSLRIMGDHGRSATFLIADGVVPSNEGRGYVLRRLLRRSVRHAYVHGMESHILPVLVDATVDVMAEGHPELGAKRDFIIDMAEREEQLFRRTLASGSSLLDQELGKLSAGAELPGSAAFKLHDTFGFPIDVTQEIIDERGFTLDRTGFDAEMQQQRARARAAFKGGDAAVRQDLYVALLDGVEASKFIGYDRESGSGRILAILRDGESVERAEQGQTVELFVDQTPFYAEAGGQVGDKGTITSESGSVAVFDTQLAIAGVHGHRAKVTAGFVQVGQDATLQIDAERREDIRKNHTGTHLLHWALRNVVGDHVHQAGSHVGPERLRFDFSHFDGLSDEEVSGVESVVNARIIENAKVQTIETTKAEAEKMGALAFFGDKYGERVRVVQTGSYSTEFCGGTHVRTTGQVGPLLLVSEGSVAANTRRVEALTGEAAYEHLVALRATLDDTARFLNARVDEVPDRVRALAERADELQSMVDSVAKQKQMAAAVLLAEQAIDMSGVRVVISRIDGTDPAALRAIAAQIRDRLGSGVVVLGADNDGKGALVGAVSSDLAGSGIQAGEIVSAGASVLGGGGSRDPELSQAGGPNGADIDAALGAVETALGKALASR